MNDKEYTLTMSLDDVNTILEALGSQPFNKVYGLIHKIHSQAQQQNEDAVLGMADLPNSKPSK